jgi:hypothetical protein
MFLTDDDGLVINMSHITAVRFKKNKNDGSYKNQRDYQCVADVHVSGREKPFTIYITTKQKTELVQFMKNNGIGETA